MQKKGTTVDAKGPTEEEFIEVMKEIKAALQELQDEPWIEGLRQLIDGWQGWTFAYDYDRIHNTPDTKALLEAAGIPPELRTPHPKYSPDFMKVVEHTHGRMWHKFCNKLEELEEKLTLEEYKEMLTECFYECADDATIMQDVLSLPKLYEIVSSSASTNIDGVPGSNGDWPPPKFYK